MLFMTLLSPLIYLKVPKMCVFCLSISSQLALRWLASQLDNQCGNVMISIYKFLASSSSELKVEKLVHGCFENF